ncbi:Amn1p [Sugiyamaella lignohabitans]|uniref:Amn1p n=1 Tax=Sugiyamaella lignohabitans TaxID=796027 RepID=A0A167DC56_9ASCO|nr:Amn1p [Sugiyamaella lignohabitans]ANB12745.1 Amn1p [Sugiyamaella lignohabitans]
MKQYIRSADEEVQWSRFEQSLNGQRLVSGSSTTSTVSTATYLSDLDSSPDSDPSAFSSTPTSPSSPSPNRDKGQSSSQNSQEFLRLSVHNARRNTSLEVVTGQVDEPGSGSGSSSTSSTSSGSPSSRIRRRLSLRVPFLGFNRDAKSASQSEVPKQNHTQLNSNNGSPTSPTRIQVPKRLLEPSLLPLDESPISSRLTSLSLVDVELDETRTTGSPYKRINLSEYSLSSSSISSQASIPSCHRALLIPEILEIIIRYVDESNVIPHEIAQRRRKPLSLKHAMLIYGNAESARAAWSKVQREETTKQVRLGQLDESFFNGLYSCLLVSRLWHAISMEILHEKLHFKNETSWQKFVTSNGIANENKFSSRLPSVLVLHKIAEAKQIEVDLIGKKVGGKLKWLEFYTCPLIVPTRELLEGNSLTKIVLPGCSRVNDGVVALIAKMCPQVEHLDLRACDYVSDRGLKVLAKRCPGIKLLNVGRTQRGELITYRGIKHIARRTCVDTLGLAGCHINDRAIWELAIHRGPAIQRLSLNNCQFLTNNSIPRILGYTRNLCVLELRGCFQISDMRPIIQFKRYREMRGHPALIEGCELFELRMREAQWQMEVETSRQVIRDCLEWLYSEDSDVNYEKLRD